MTMTPKFTDITYFIEVAQTKNISPEGGLTPGARASWAEGASAGPRHQLSLSNHDTWP